MPRAFAGLLDPRDPRRAAERVRAALAAEDAGEPGVVVSGPLALGWVGGAGPTRSGERLVLVDGEVWEVAGAPDGGPAAASGDALAAAHLGAPGPGGEPAAPRDALAASLLRAGERALPFARGDFAVVVWDGARGEGFAARDQQGARGLVWHAGGGRLAVASEVALLLRLLDARPAPDDVAMAHWLAGAGQPDGRTLYAGVRRVGGGGLLALRPEPRPRAWWRPRPAPLLDRPRDELVELVRAALVTAVGRRSDGPATGVLLSGGLDSSSVAAVGRRCLPAERAPRTAWSAVFPAHPSVDEHELIAALCTETGLEAHRVAVRGGSVLAGALPYLERWELPPISPNLFFWLPLLRRARDAGVTALLDGEGGDEVFGLSPLLVADALARGRPNEARALVARIPGARGGAPNEAAARRLLREYGLRGLLPLSIQRAVRRARGPARYAPAWFLPATARTYVDTDERPAWKTRGRPRWWAWLASTVAFGRPEPTLDHVRRRAALAGLQARHPLLDIDLVELVLRLPPALAYDSRRSRPLLREAVAGVLPDRLRLRPDKSTFDAVFREAMTGPDLPALRRLLAASGTELTAYLHRERLETDLASPPLDDPGALAHWCLLAWRAATAECWLRAQADPAAPSRLLAEHGPAPADVAYKGQQDG